MIHQNLNEVIKDCTNVESYILFRKIEEWCYANLHACNWKLDWSSTMVAYGVDIPTKILFKQDSDLTAFRLRFFTSS